MDAASAQQISLQQMAEYAFSFFFCAYTAVSRVVSLKQQLEKSELHESELLLQLEAHQELDYRDHMEYRLRENELLSMNREIDMLSADKEELKQEVMNLRQEVLLRRRADQKTIEGLKQELSILRTMVIRDAAARAGTLASQKKQAGDE